MSRLPWAATIAALLGLSAIAGSFVLDAHTLLAAYLATAVAVSAIPVGALAVLMLTYLVRGSWTEALHAPLTAAALTIPVGIIFFIPVFVGMPWLYPWAHNAAGEPGSFKAAYLTMGFFAARTALYFTLWTALAIWVRWSWANPRYMIISASAGLIVYALTASLAGTDWLASLTPEFHSSIYGLLFLTFQVLAGFAFALAVALSRRGAPTFRYGAILLAALLLWAYNHAMQYIIIWAGDVPDEVVWYLRRETGAWGIVMWSLVLLQFILPFFVLLSERLRNERGPLLTIAALTLTLRPVEAYLFALPGIDLDGAALLFAVPGTIVVLAACWGMAFARSFDHVLASARDTRPLADAFDAAGSAMSARRP